MQKEKRLFVCINFPQEAKKEIAGFLDAIPKEKFRKVLPENLHITLCFLGRMPEGKIKKTTEKLPALENFGKFEMELTGFGHFESRIIWLGTGKGSEELKLLAKN